MSTTMPSADCRDGKHRACSGEGWDDEAGAVVQCPCVCHTYCNRDSCWLEPGHDGDCKPGGCWSAGPHQWGQR